MLWYEVIEEFNIIFNLTDYILIIFEIINFIILIIGSVIFFKKYTNKKNKFFLRIAIVFIFFFISRLSKFIQWYYIGRTSLIDPYEGAGLITQIIAIIGITSAYLTLYHYLEKTAIKSTHYLLSIFTIFTGIFFMISTTIRTQVIIFLTSIFGVIMSSAIALMYLNLSIKSDGKVRRNTFIIAIGFLFIDLAIYLAGTESGILELALLFSFTPPILFFIGWAFLIAGFQEESL